MIAFAVSTSPDGATFTCVGLTSAAVPWMWVTPFFLNRNPIPFTSRSETWRLRFWATA